MKRTSLAKHHPVKPKENARKIAAADGFPGDEASRVKSNGYEMAILFLQVHSISLPGSSSFPLLYSGAS